MSREETKLLTRYRLMQATLEILVEQGREALTTGRVAKRAGIAQATFYVHFRDIDDLLDATARETMTRLQPALSRALRLDAGSDFDAAIVHIMRMALMALLPQADLVRLFVAEYYRKDSALGRSARTLVDDLCTTLAGDLRGLERTRALGDERLRTAVEVLVWAVVVAGLEFAEHPERDLEVLVDTLRAMSTGLFRPDSDG